MLPTLPLYMDALFRGMTESLYRLNSAGYIGELTTDHKSQQAARETPHIKIFLDHLVIVSSYLPPEAEGEAYIYFKPEGAIPVMVVPVADVMLEWEKFCHDHEDCEEINRHAFITADIIHIGARVRFIDPSPIVKTLAELHRAVKKRGLGQMCENEKDKPAVVDWLGWKVMDGERVDCALYNHRLLRFLLFISRLHADVTHMVKTPGPSSA